MKIVIAYRREDTSSYALGLRREFAKSLPECLITDQSGPDLAALERGWRPPWSRTI